jgi:acetyl esterase/lipase
MSKAEVQAIVQMLAAADTGEELSVEAQRAGMEQMTAAFPPPEDGRTEATLIGGVSCEWQWVEGIADGPVLLYLHGGGYVLGSVNTHRSLVMALSRASGIRGLSVGYRLAPEHPFPAAVDDALAVYQGLLDQGRDPASIAIAGDSAGGGLALALLLALKQRGLPQPACAALLSPWSDLTLSGEAYQTRLEADPFLKQEQLAAMASHYVGADAASDPLASPLLGALDGLAPLRIDVGDDELLLSDSTQLAERARAAGTEVELEIWPDMIHVFQAFSMILEEGRQSIDKIGKFISERLA